MVGCYLSPSDPIWISSPAGVNLEPQLFSIQQRLLLAAPYVGLTGFRAASYILHHIFLTFFQQELMSLGCLANGI